MSDRRAKQAAFAEKKRNTRKKRAPKAKGKLTPQRQIADHCRVHALVAVLGRSVSRRLNHALFSVYCDRFDQMHGIQPPFTAKYFSVVSNEENIFSYVLTQYHLNSGYIAPGSDSHDQFKHEVKAQGLERAVVFDYKHAWALVKTKHNWFSVDSLRSEDALQPIYTFPEQCGYVYVIEKKKKKKKKKNTTEL